MKAILSVSRRSDIPAFYADWFLEALRLGHCSYPNPVTGRPVRLSLLPGTWAGVVFWSRNPAPLLKGLNEIDRCFDRRVNFQLTLTALPQLFEAASPHPKVVINTMKSLSLRYGREAIIWRFDPILLTSITNAAEHCQRFERLAREIAPHAATCVVSFADNYRKALRRLAVLEARNGVSRLDTSLADRLQLVAGLQQRAQRAGLRLQICCEDELLACSGVEKSRCLDYGRLGYPDLCSRRSHPTRNQCACHNSRDIGYYDSCIHNCVYCYATRDADTARKFLSNYYKTGKKLPFDEAKDEVPIDTLS